MFIKKKKLYQKKSFYITILIMLLIWGAITVVPWGKDNNREAAETDVKMPYEQEQYETQENEVNEEEDAEKQNIVGEVKESELPYYWVIENNGVVSVFYYDEKGNISKYKDTEIAFDLLNESDQMSFSEGIMIKTKEALITLLQDFES